MVSWYDEYGNCPWCNSDGTLFCNGENKICLTCIGKLYRNEYVPRIETMFCKHSNRDVEK